MPSEGDPGEPGWEQQGGDPGHQLPDQQEPLDEVRPDKFKEKTFVERAGGIMTLDDLKNYK